ncbi:MAG: DUF4270 family protein, partial [Prolixibacteraceae bacterium]|nr:DUF4270 family protein [Prolixibacteraceae bacterium]
MAYRLIDLSFIILFLVSSCTEDETSSVSIGENFINSQSTIAMVDSFTVKMSTVLLDSVPTSGNETLLAGTYTDEFLGKVSASGYFQLTLNDSAIVNQESVFDSLTLILHFTRESYGDTTQYQELNVHRVLQDIEEHEDGNLYNTSSIPYSTEPLGSKSIMAKPHKSTELEIRLSDELGLEFFDKMKNRSEEFNTTADFRDYFKGLVIVPGDNNTSVLTFSATDSLLAMVLYSHYVE